MALDAYRKACIIAESFDEPTRELCTCYLEIANCLDMLGEGDGAFECMQKAIKVAHRIDKYAFERQLEMISMMFCPEYYTDQEYINRVEQYMADGTFYECLPVDEQYILKSVYWARRRIKDKALATLDSILVDINRLETKIDVYSFFGDWGNALKSYTVMAHIRDSVQSVIHAEDMASMDAEMTSTMFRSRAENLETRNRFSIIMLAVAFLLVAIASVAITLFVHRARLRRKNMVLENHLLRLQHSYNELENELASQKVSYADSIRRASALERENKRSLQYARVIQDSTLPELRVFDGRGIDGSFSIFRPYRSVSGDFYWARRVGQRLAFACADCTGHDVQGAFMSLIGSTLLDSVCMVNELPSPDAILTELDRRVRVMLGHRDEKTVLDGMDISIAIIDPAKRVMSYSSARRPIFVMRAGEILELPSTKRRIGDRDEKVDCLPFSAGEMKLEANDTIYMFTDGVTDLFGGTDDVHEGRRLMKSGLKRILRSISYADIRMQGEAICQKLDEWQGYCEQADDIAMIGIRI